VVHERLLAKWLRETDRPPLRAGDPVSWGVLTEGTLLDGTRWPGFGGTAEGVSS
jgi:hypothetical protein